MKLRFLESVREYSVWYMLIFLLIYLYIGTGIHSDDWILLNQVSHQTLSEVLFPSLSKIHVLVLQPVAYYIDVLQYYFFQKHYLFYDFIKIVLAIISLWMLYFFAKEYMPKQAAVFFSFFSFFYITHDSVNYWIITQPYILTFALIFYSHFLIDKLRYKQGVIAGLVGAFMGYASPPYTFGLSVIFLYRKEYKKFVIFLLPQILYLVYYFIITNVFGLSKGRIDNTLSLEVFVKQLILQIGTFIDSVIGPSFWLKMYYAILELSEMSIGVGVVATLLFYYYFRPVQIKLNKEILLALSAVLFLSFVMFSLTGQYPQLAFNLGDRVTIYSSFLLAYLIVFYLMRTKVVATVVFSLFIFSVLGVSDHWKMWNKKQLHIIDNMAKNEALQTFDRTKQLFVINNQYSHLGKMAHIEFFEEQPMVPQILEIAIGKKFKASTLHHRFFYKKGKIIDKKYHTYIDVGEKIFIYDSQKDKLFTVQRDKIQEFIDKLPEDTRHWIFFLDKENILMHFVLKLMPRLEYSF